MRRWYAGIGSRKTPKDVCEEFTRTAKWLNGLGYWLRSGGAAGADIAFERGAKEKSRIYRKDDTTLASMKIAYKYHPNWERCSFDSKLLLGRNPFQIAGDDLKTPVDFVACWTADGNDSGGTGNAIRHALDLDIPVFNFFDPEASEDLKGYVRKIMAEVAAK